VRLRLNTNHRSNRESILAADHAGSDGQPPTDVQTHSVIKLAKFNKTYHTGEVDVHAVRGVSREIMPANWSPSWVPAAPANPPG